jgi:hypothetical protein
VAVGASAWPPPHQETTAAAHAGKGMAATLATAHASTQNHALYVPCGMHGILAWQQLRNPHPSPVHRSTTTTIRENEASLGRVGARRDPSSLSHHSGRPDTSPSPRLCRKKATAIRAIPARSSAGPGPFPSRPRSSRAEEKEQASGVEGATRAGAAAVR